MAASRHTSSGVTGSKQRKRLSELLQIGDAQQRLARLVHDVGKHPALEHAWRTEAYRVEGCLVRIWLVPEFRNGTCFFRCDSDALSLKAVGGLLCELYSGLTPAQICMTTVSPLKSLGILHQLAENRRRTIARIEEKIRRFAMEHQTKET